MKRVVATWMAVFLAWSVLDGFGHGLALRSTYAKYPEIFRPQAEMNVGIIYLGVAIAAACFVAVYSQFVSAKNARNGACYGLIFGIGVGASMACGGYAVHPIRADLAISWFVLTVIEATVGGWISGMILRCSTEAETTCGPTLPKGTGGIR